MMRALLPFVALLVLVTGGIHSRFLLAQNTAQESSSFAGQTSDPLKDKWTTAPKNWQLTPTDLSKQTDTVSAEVRAKRNSFWMRPIIQTALKSHPLPGIKVEFPEVGDVAGDESIWVVAGFEGVHVFAIDRDSTELYTEMNMRVIDVIEAPSDYPISKGSVLDVNLLGGTAKTADGKIHQFRVEPEQFSAHPGHTYFLHLLYDSQYEFISPFQRWEVISGKLVPDDEMESYRTEHGRSVLAGKTIDEAARYIQSVPQRRK